jgi:iron complex outermembrane receptor protein
MKNILIVALLFISNAIGASTLQEFILSGKITDKQTGKTLSGATVFFSDLKLGTITNKEGEYKISIPQGSHVVEVSYMGYATQVQTITIQAATTINFNMNSTVVEAGDVMVTSFLRATSSRRTPTPVTIIKKEELFRGISTNLIDALSKVPGVSQVATGPAISKPIIRGLGYNRVVVMHDGIRQEGQQWGDEHGVEIDEYNVQRTEVLKVPASLIYGSDALAGVINIISNAPVAEGVTKGNVFTNYQSNNGLFGRHIDIASNKKGLFWGVNTSMKDAGDYQNKYDGDVFNSKFNERSGSAYIGVDRKWGSTQFTYSNFYQNLGIVEGDRDETGAFIQTAGSTGRSMPAIPMQKIQHTKYTLDNTIKLGADRLKAIVGLQRNQRMEFGNEDNLKERELYFDLQTINYSLQYLVAEKNNWKNTYGINGMQQTNTNRGLETLIPDYTSFEIGAFHYTQYRTAKTQWSGGFRVDQKQMSFIDPASDPNRCPDGMMCIALYRPPVETKKTFNNISGAIGVAHDLNESTTIKFNLARGFRAPNLAELSSYGAHEGTNRFEYGNAALRSEKSLQLDAAIEWSNAHLSIAGNLFYNTVRDYIFYQKLTGINGADSIISQENEDGSVDELYAFAFKQSNAHLYGAELNVDIHPHPLDWLHIENSISLIKAQFDQTIDGSKNLPGIPSARWLTEVRFDLFKGANQIKNSSLSIQVDNNFAQNHAFTGYNTETNTPAYHLINMGYSTNIMRKQKVLFQVSLIAQNITDVAYQNHLSRLKYTAENMATGRMGVFNMGRNFSIKVNVPLVF